MTRTGILATVMATCLLIIGLSVAGFYAQRWFNWKFAYGADVQATICQMVKPEALERICRNCEYWDAGGERYREAAQNGDCLNPNSDRFAPEAKHSCSCFYPNTTAS